MTDKGLETAVVLAFSAFPPANSITLTVRATSSRERILFFIQILLIFIW
jgi:hypothetical protein